MKLLKSENDLQQLSERIEGSLPVSLEGEQKDKAVEFTMQSIIGRQISMYDGLLSKKRQQLDEAITKLKVELESHSQGASEVQDQRVIRATTWVEQNESQLEFLETYCRHDMDKAKEAYASFFGKPWMSYQQSLNAAVRNSDTSARAEAEELLKKYTS